jgi:hypothetical protein
MWTGAATTWINKGQGRAVGAKTGVSLLRVIVGWVSVLVPGPPRGMADERGDGGGDGFADACGDGGGDGFADAGDVLIIAVSESSPTRSRSR